MSQAVFSFVSLNRSWKCRAPPRNLISVLLVRSQIVLVLTPLHSELLSKSLAIHSLPLVRGRPWYAFSVWVSEVCMLLPTSSARGRWVSWWWGNLAWAEQCLCQPVRTVHADVMTLFGIWQALLASGQMALVLAPVLPQLLGDHQVVLGMHVLKRPLVVSRSGHSLNSILLAFPNQRSSV